jgi:hypothetical protein
VIVGALLKEVFPLIARWSRTVKGHNLIGIWDSAWGRLPNGPPIHHESLTFERQQGFDVSGTAVSTEQPQKKWEVKGRYDGTFLQMYYYPSGSSQDSDFLDYGCYFLRRRADGSFEGYSTGFGVDDENGGASTEGITTDYHILKRK